MKKLILFTTLISSLFSLTIDEAVERGLANSTSVKINDAQIASRNLDIKLANAGFYPSIDASYNRQIRDEETASSEKDFSYVSLSASINLFNGMKDYFNKKSASDSVRIARFEKSADVADLKLNIKRSYINHLNAKMEQENQKASLELLKEQYKTAKLQFEQGIIAKDELLKVEVDMLDVEKAVLSSEASVETTWFALRRSLGGVLEKDESFTEPKQEKSVQYDYRLSKDKMFESRSELKALHANKSYVLNQKESIDSGYLPKADLQVSHNIYEEEKKSGGVVTIPKDETVANLVLSWNIYSGGRTSNSGEQMKYQALIVDENIRDLRLTLDFQFETAYSELKIAKKSLIVAKKSFESAKKSYDSVFFKFREGVANNTELLDAREDLTKATSDLNSARYALLLANANFERVIGE